MNESFMEVIKTLLSITVPAIMELIKSKVVPALKRRAYERVDEKVDKIIEDLAQNASKIKDTVGAKRIAYEEGTRLGIETLRAIAIKLNKAADKIEEQL